ncbi:hypothetical protein OG806_02265 [Streptomyces sp. NBC_00882]|uniref:TRADD-N-associated membrane domain-containing protein n=1 Tax=Streptomyces TaxID=1883 RepID=UPI00386A5A68|nr:hypothetical protein OG806_02265 [Streptomyces sp. NBC_00882]WSZ55374.1 hypothetical protein OH824_01840 [Streptomyces canus]
MSDVYFPVVVGLFVVASVAATAKLLVRTGAQITEEISQTRRRLREDVLGEMPPEAGAKSSTASENTPTDSAKPPTATARPPVDTDTRFARLLIEYYAYGLTQARRSFSASLTCSLLGGLVLIAGVALAIFRAESTGELYASATASVAGLLTTAIGVLFHRRADAALKHMESQSHSLRQDMKIERDARLAVQLLKDVQDQRLMAHLQAALILKFSAAKLPELTGVLKPTELLPEPSANGAVPHQPSESSTS